VGVAELNEKRQLLRSLKKLMSRKNDNCSEKKKHTMMSRSDEEGRWIEAITK